MFEVCHLNCYFRLSTFQSDFQNDIQCRKFFVQLRDFGQRFLNIILSIDSTKIRVAPIILDYTR